MPRRTDHDSQGVSLEVGQDVAYNMSGQVHPGRILTIDARCVSVLYLGPPMTEYVRDDSTGQWKRREKLERVSKVRDGASILVTTREMRNGL